MPSKVIANVTYLGTKVVGGSGTPTTVATGTGWNQLTGSPTTFTNSLIPVTLIPVTMFKLLQQKHHQVC
jgi:hypothetical protein